MHVGIAAYGNWINGTHSPDYSDLKTLLFCLTMVVDAKCYSAHIERNEVEY